MPGDDVSAHRVVLPDIATVRNAESVRDLLLRGFDQPTDIEVDCSGLADADLCLVQLLLAARTMAGEHGRVLRLAEPASGVLLDVLNRGGFLTVTEGLDNEERDFWMAKGVAR